MSVGVWACCLFTGPNAASTHYTGPLTDGATWVADVPASWNGTIILYSHGFGPLIAQDMDRVTREVPGVEDVDLELTFDPAWTPDRMSDDAKFILGFG